MDDPVQGILHEEVSEPVYKRGLQVLSVAEVAGLLGMGRSWVYEQIKRGEMPGVHLGGSVKVRREDLEAYIEARRRQASAGGETPAGRTPDAALAAATRAAPLDETDKGTPYPVHTDLER